MARKRRVDSAGFVFHVLNRRAGRSRLFSSPGDYAAFEKVLAEAAARFPGMRLLAYCLMPTHWHLVLWPRQAGVLSRYMQWLTTTHMRRWHARRNSIGTGPVYQGRFKSFPVQADEHLRTACRYVERNPLRAGLVKGSARRWRWSSAAPRAPKDGPAMGRAADERAADERPWLLPRDQWPADSRPDWAEWVDAPQTPAEEKAALAALRHSLARGAPYGDDRWARAAGEKLGLQSSLNPIGRPRRLPGTTPPRRANHAPRRQQKTTRPRK